MANKLRNTDYPLTELHRSGYEVADGYPDIRGWNILNGVGQKIGEVVELIFDPLSNSVRYLVVHIEGKPINLLSRDVLIPIGLAELMEETGTVSVPSITLGHLALLPTYKRGEFNRAFERTVRGVFTGEKETVIGEETENPVFYNHDHFDQERFYQKRKVHTVNESPGWARERITPKDISNRDSRNLPADKLRNDTEPFEPFRDGSIELTEHAEVPVIKKEARIVEEVKVKREISERDETVRDNTRRTEVDVERIPKEDLQ